MNAGVALITGASSGIGEAVSRHLVRDGWRVGLVARRPDLLNSLVEELGHDKAFPVVADVTRADQVAEAVNSVAGHWGRLDLVIVNAGLLEVGRIEETRLEQWAQVLATNLDGAFFTIRSALPLIKESAGRFVLVSSVAASKGMPGLGAYSASKAGLRGLSESLAAENERNGVRVNLVTLGPTDTAMLERPGASEFKLRPTEVADIILWLTKLPRHVVIREIPLRASVRPKRDTAVSSD